MLLNSSHGSFKKDQQELKIQGLTSQNHPCLLELQSVHFIICALGFTQGQCVALLAVTLRASTPILVSVKRYWCWVFISFKMSILRVYNYTFFPCTQMVHSFKQTQEL